MKLPSAATLSKNFPYLTALCNAGLWGVKIIKWVSLADFCQRLQDTRLASPVYSFCIVWLFMSNWVWLSRVTLLGLVGTAALATLFFSRLSLSDTRNNDYAKRTSEADRLRATAITPEEMQVLEISASQPPTPLTQQKPLLKSGGNKKVQARPFNLQQSLNTHSRLFDAPTSLGMLVIGVAEGTYRLVEKEGTLYAQQTLSYFGHTDPGNLSWGEQVTNYGPCSDQGRSGGNIALAEQLCLERSRGALPTHLVDLNSAGIDPNQDLEAILNTADLYNQASPIHSRYFPKALAMARRGGLTGIDALAWARTASFYLNTNKELDIETGSNQATGLLGICARENRWVTEWQCVYDDQMRRVKAIAKVLEKYRLFAQKKTQKSS
jgi:hypothetical protein